MLSSETTPARTRLHHAFLANHPGTWPQCRGTAVFPAPVIVVLSGRHAALPLLHGRRRQRSGCFFKRRQATASSDGSGTPSAPALAGYLHRLAAVSNGAAARCVVQRSSPAFRRQQLRRHFQCFSSLERQFRPLSSCGPSPVLEHWLLKVFGSSDRAVAAKREVLFNTPGKGFSRRSGGPAAS